MDLLFEFLFELIFDAGVEASKCSRVPKVIRYFLIFLICLFYLFILGLIFFVAITGFKDNILIGISFTILGLFLLVMSIIKFKETYLKKTNK